jgi:hypothetical protein
LSSKEDDRSEEKKDDDILNFRSQTTKEEFTEDISSIEVFFGSRVSYVLSQFVKRVIEAFKEKYPKTIIT